MKAFIKKVKAFWKDLVADAKYRQFISESMHEPVHRLPVEMVLGLYYEVRYEVSIRICEYFGHKLVDHGYAGPESGCIDLECTRCGWSSHTQLY